MWRLISLLFLRPDLAHDHAHACRQQKRVYLILDNCQIVRAHRPCEQLLSHARPRSGSGEADMDMRAGSEYKSKGVALAHVDMSWSEECSGDGD